MKARILLLGLALAIAPAARAEVKTHALCGEGMVLQQKSSARVWGTADKGEEVTVKFKGQEAKKVKADDNGNWVVEIATGDAGGPFEMVISGTANKIVYKNVLVGEVWVCSGQSNMEWSVGGCDKTDKEFASSAAPNPMLRHFAVKRSPRATPQTETAGAWVEASPKTVFGFTACGYFFGRNLQETLKVPVGLIHTSWGGTRIEAWMSTKALEAAGVKDLQAKDNAPNSASGLYNGMIYPVLNYQIKGAIWYQGESNTGNSYAYRTLHPGMIEDWRANFKSSIGPLHFYFVQLAPFTAAPKTPGPSTWAELREAQTMTLKKTPNTGMAVITDFGNEYDIHPTPKRPVGERLALAARAQTYGEKIVYSGPMYKDVKFDGSKATLSFDHVGGGLIAQALVLTAANKNKQGAWRVDKSVSNSELVGFTVCGKDQVFHVAKAEIVGNTVVVSCDKVEAPVAVRYGWANHPICNLFNREGLPASPFRTDDFKGVTQPK